MYQLLAGSLSFLSPGSHLLIKLHSMAAGSAPPTRLAFEIHQRWHDISYHAFASIRLELAL